MQIDQHLIIWPIAIKGDLEKTIRTNCIYHCSSANIISQLFCQKNTFLRNVLSKRAELRFTFIFSFFLHLSMFIVIVVVKLCLVQPSYLFYFTCPQYLFYWSCASLSAAQCIEHPVHQKRSKKSDIWISLSVTIPLIPICPI